MASLITPGQIQLILDEELQNETFTVVFTKEDLEGTDIEIEGDQIEVSVVKGKVVTIVEE